MPDEWSKVESVRHLFLVIDLWSSHAVLDAANGFPGGVAALVQAPTSFLALVSIHRVDDRSMKRGLVALRASRVGSPVARSVTPARSTSARGSKQWNAYCRERAVASRLLRSGVQSSALSAKERPGSS